VKLDVTGLHLDFRGRREFFERVIDPLVLVMAGGTPRAAAAAPASQNGSDETVNGAPHDDDLVPAAVQGYEPPSDLWGLFHRQLDPVKLEASDDLPASRAAAFAFFLWNYEKKEAFREEEVEGCFRADGLEPPDDASSVCESLARRRIFAPAEGAGMWRLTPRGVAHVRSRLLSA
jgi:uncharacterized protein YjhX (UPF0386 family)